MGQSCGCPPRCRFGRNPPGAMGDDWHKCSFTHNFPTGAIPEPSAVVPDFACTLKLPHLPRKCVEKMKFMTVNGTTVAYVPSIQQGNSCIWNTEILCVYDRGSWVNFYLRSGQLPGSFFVHHIRKIWKSGKVTIRKIGFHEAKPLLFYCCELKGVDWQDFRSIIWHIMKLNGRNIAPLLNSGTLSTLLPLGIPLGNILNLNGSSLVKSGSMFCDRLRQVCISTILCLHRSGGWKLPLLPRNVVFFIVKIVSLGYFSESKRTVSNSFSLQQRLEFPQLKKSEEKLEDWNQTHFNVHIKFKGMNRVPSSKDIIPIAEGLQKEYSEWLFWKRFSKSFDIPREQLWKTSVCIQALNEYSTKEVTEPPSRKELLDRSRKWLVRCTQHNCLYPLPKAVNFQMVLNPNYYALHSKG